MNFSQTKKYPSKRSKSQSKTAQRTARRQEIIAQTLSRNSSTSSYEAGMVRVYTDGACSSNGRRGAVAGWGVHFPDQEISDLCGPLPGANQTNQRAELYAIIQAVNAISQLPEALKIVIYTDSEYSINCLTKWIANWKRNSWKNSKRQPVMNSDLIQELDNLINSTHVHGRLSFSHVRGHVNDPYNDAADRLARQGAAQNPL